MPEWLSLFALVLLKRTEFCYCCIELWEGTFGYTEQEMGETPSPLVGCVECFDVALNPGEQS